MRVIGLISGTSADAIEAVLAEVEGVPPGLEGRILASRSVPLPPELRRRIHAVAAGEGDARAVCLLDTELGERFAAAALQIIGEPGPGAEAVALIGSHGQTIWHEVRDDGTVAATLQVGSAAVIAERTGLPTVSDLRSRDIAAGGQGAPLVAYVDWLLLRHASRSRAVQNLGGIGNVAFLPPHADDATAPVAFDTGPANVLIDVVIGLLSEGREGHDADGATASRGRVDEAWLETLLGHPYFQQPPPKTTGRELFGPAMGRALLEEGRRRGRSDEDVVATLTAFSAASVADQYRRFLPGPPDEVIVAGGGTRNPVLMAELEARLEGGTRLLKIDALGIPAEAKEALAMAVIAHESWHGRPGSLPVFTGARHPVVLGTITPGGSGR